MAFAPEVILRGSWYNSCQVEAFEQSPLESPLSDFANDQDATFLANLNWKALTGTSSHELHLVLSRKESTKVGFLSRVIEPGSFKGPVRISGQVNIVFTLSDSRKGPGLLRPAKAVPPISHNELMLSNKQTLSSPIKKPWWKRKPFRYAD